MSSSSFFFFSPAWWLSPEQKQDVLDVSGRKTTSQAMCHYTYLFMHLSSAQVCLVHFDLQLSITVLGKRRQTKQPGRHGSRILVKQTNQPLTVHELTILTWCFILDNQYYYFKGFMRAVTHSEVVFLHHTTTSFCFCAFFFL